MYVEKGGTSFGFCPGKATWDLQAAEVMKVMIVASETNTMLEAGGLNDQPSWFVDIATWFIPAYRGRTFMNRAKAILNSGLVQMPKGKNSGHHK